MENSLYRSISRAISTLSHSDFVVISRVRAAMPRFDDSFYL